MKLIILFILTPIILSAHSVNETEILKKKIMKLEYEMADTRRSLGFLYDKILPKLTNQIADNIDDIDLLKREKDND